MNNPDEAFINQLPEESRRKLNQITDADQLNSLLNCLKRGEEISPYAWIPIESFKTKLGLFQKVIEDPQFRPSSYWSADGKPIIGSHTQLRSPTYDVGEHLPELDPGEVEIARVVLQSTTGDVISIRARRAADHISYRVVDEYETEFACRPEVSTVPLALEQLLSLIHGFQDEDGAFVPRVLGQFADDEDADEFLLAHSDFYPGLQGCFTKRVTESGR
jgi:hypothetical protein